MPNDETTEFDRRGISKTEAEKIANDVWWSNCKKFSIPIIGVIGLFGALLMWGLNSQAAMREQGLQMRDQRLDFIVESLQEMSEYMKVLVLMPQQVAHLERVAEDQKKTAIKMNERITILEMVVK